VITNATGSVVKGFTLSEDGALKTKSHAKIYEGKAERVEAADLADLLQIIEKLNDNQALCFGVTDAPTAPIVTKKALKRGRTPGAIARDREHFHYASQQPGVLMVDIDQRKKWGAERLGAI